MTWSVIDYEGSRVEIKLIFSTAPFSDMYKVYIRSADVQTELSHTVSKVLAAFVNFHLYNFLFFIIHLMTL